MVYEIWTSRKTLDEGEPMAPEGYTMVKMRNRPYYSTYEKAEAELESILSKPWAKSEEHYAIMGCNLREKAFKRELSRGRECI